MSGKTKSMSQIKQLLRLYEQGNGVKTISRVLGLSKNTVKEYLRKTALLGCSPAELLLLEDPVLESKFHAGTAAYTDLRFAQFKDKLDYYSLELKRKGVNKRLLWEEYRELYPAGYSYSQFCFHLSQQLVAARPSLVLNHQPGDKLYVDFAGQSLSYTDPATGELIPCQVFVACLPYSDYSFVMAVHSQGINNFIHALNTCLQFFGGVPSAIVPDNLKSAVIKANRYEPQLNRALEDFANHYGCTVLPARVGKPKDKALVENQVRLIYSRVYAKLRNRQFFSLTDLNRAISEKNREHTQTRMQQKPFSREERFLADEKSHLNPLPAEVFELKYYKQLKAGQNNHLYLSEDKHYYSVPYQFTGVKMQVVYTRSMVHIYAQGKRIALHVRDYKIGGYTTVREHLCSHHQHYLNRSPEYYLQRAKERSEVLYQLVEHLFSQNRHPEQLYRTCDGLLRLERKSDPRLFAHACKQAMEVKNYSYKFIQNILENNSFDEPLLTDDKPLPAHTNVRGKEYYTQTVINFK
jgi:transposase